MQSGVIEKLYFSIGLIDKVSGTPAGKVAKSIQKIQKTARAGWTALGSGIGIIAALGFGMLNLSASARDFDKSMGEVASLGVPAAELDKLGVASKKFAIQYGGDAAAVVRSAYDIQSAIPGMAEGALAAFTYQSALLAKAGKALPEETTKYMGTMFNIFKTTADKIGQANWVEQLTGQTAYAVKIFKTTASGMNEAFKGLGSMGVQMGVEMPEQIAVLGTLQATMGGAEAGTAYKAMLGKFAQAQGVLKMSFKDSAGNMLPVYQIIEKIDQRIGHLNKDVKVDVLNKAFGEVGAKAVMNMMDKTGQLKQDIEAIGKIKDASGAEAMAAAMTDPLERLAGIGNVLKITFGKIILPGVNLVLGILSEMAVALVWLLDVFPPLRWAIGLITAAVVALAISWGVLKISVGVTGLWNALALKIRLVNVTLWKMHVISGTMTRTQKIAAIANWLWSKSLAGMAAAAKFFRLNLLWNNIVMIASAVWSKILGAAQWIMSTGFWASCAAVWGFTAALLACPLTWIVIGIAALVAGIVALIYYWDEVCGWIMKYSDYLLMLLGPIGWTAALLIRFWDDIAAGAEWCYNKITGWFTGLWDFGRNVVSGIFQWIVGKITGFLDWMTKIPIIGGTIKSGLDALKDFAGMEVTQTAKIERPVVPSVKAARNSDIRAGGVNNTSNKTNNWGGVTINTQNPVGPGEMEDLWALEA